MNNVVKMKKSYDHINDVRNEQYWDLLQSLEAKAEETGDEMIWAAHKAIWDLLKRVPR